MAVGATQILITHAAQDIDVDITKKGSTLRNLAKYLEGYGIGAGLGATVDVKQNYGTGIAATGVVTCAGVTAADTVTINGTVLTSEQQRATATATFAALADGDSVTLNGFVMTAKTTVVNALVQFALGADDTAAAANCVTLVNATTSAFVTGLITATSALGVVTFRAVTSGTAGNAFTLISSDGTRAAVTGSGTLAGGVAVTNNKWDTSPGATNTQTAADLVRCILASSTALVSGACTAANVAGAVTVSANYRWTGAAGNAFTLASSNGSRLAVTAVTNGRLIGGIDAAAKLLTF